MTYYYTALKSKSQAFLLESRMRLQGITCDLTYMPRPVMEDVCSLGVKFEESDFNKAVDIIRRTGFTDCRLYRETRYPNDCRYTEINFI